MKRKKTILIVLLIAAGSASWYGYREYNRANKDLGKVKADVALTAADLVKTFESNEKKANASYLGKIILVSGAVKNIDKDDMGYYTVIIGVENSTSSVRCSVDSLHTAEAVSLKGGEFVSVKGACTGFNADDLLGSDVILNRCVIENK